MSDSEASFQTEKQNVLGELSSKFNKFNIQEEDLPPPPPVFQTFGTPVPGADEEDLPPPPPFLQIKVDNGECGGPPPPPPPSITPPDYSKLSPRKQEDDNCIKPRLNPVSQNSGRIEDKVGNNTNPYLNKRSEDYVESLMRPNMAEKKIIPIQTDEGNLPPPPPRGPSSTPPSRRGSSTTPSTPRGSSTTPPTTPRKPSLQGMSPPSSRKQSAHSQSGSRPSLDINMQEVTRIKEALDKYDDGRDATDGKDKDHCYNCKKKIEINGIVAMDRPYHKECFQCSSCEKVIQARFNTKDQQPYCDVCFQEEAERCSICEGIITGDSLKSGDKYFHPHCMKCSVCGKELSGTYFTSGNALICEDDYKSTLEKCSVCGDILSGAFYKVGGENICEKDYKNQLSSCQVCQKPVEGKMLKLSEKVFHPDCFNCTVCKKNLAGVAFTQDEEKRIHCTECFQKKHASVCAGCGYAIIPEKGETTAERIRVQGKDFHPKCFKCEDCGLRFDSRTPGHECYPLDSAFLCRVCNVTRCNNKHRQ